MNIMYLVYFHVGVYNLNYTPSTLGVNAEGWILLVYYVQFLEIKFYSLFSGSFIDETTKWQKTNKSGVVWISSTT
jgi:hypothetical protein